ncbi:MAG TPA: pyridoxal 5'-phosphate synthase glutaminase subunit PdxT, partial [Actinomycetota bacterium]|nr:pyridoxal 5'-phosphate synthase glutaminase subunit PdxT [Actinomycetota bacterium]
MKAGVLALQGDFREHARMFAECGVTPILVRTTDDLASVDCLAIPGGESTAIGRLARVYGLVEPIKERIARGMPVFGTCAGMIVLARTVPGGPPLLDMLDIEVERNAYGRQVDSFEADVDVRGVGPVRGVFIRAPKVGEVGKGVNVLAEHDGRPVVVEQGRVLAASFHPEMAGDPRLHERLLAS